MENVFNRCHAYKGITLQDMNFNKTLIKCVQSIIEKLNLNGASPMKPNLYSLAGYQK